ncbi:MAG: DinB family protein [Ardenticatenaceae bacterium]
MLKAAADVLIGTRQLLYNTLKDLTQEQWFTQPKGFANNVAWNVGHLIVAQQGLVYRRLGVPGHISGKMTAMYRPGTSPADWSSKPDTDELLKLLVELPKKMAEDVAAGKFDNYVKSEGKTLGTFPPPESSAHAIIFNQFHEGVHAGNIGDLLAFVK